jgi:hypothetical protein
MRNVDQAALNEMTKPFRQSHSFRTLPDHVPIATSIWVSSAC